MKGLIRAAVARSVGVSIVFLAVALLGFVSLRRLAIDLLPAVDVPWISVVTAYEGVAPEEVETLLTRPLEQAVSKVQGVDSIEATSAEGLSRLQLQFAWGTELRDALDDVRAAIDGVRAWLPEEADAPGVYKFDLSAVPVMSLGVTGTEDGRRLKFIAEDTLSRALERQPGVASVDARGGRDREIHVELDSTRLAALGISASQVTEALARENRTVSAGDMMEAGQQVVIRTAGEFTSLEDLAATVVTTKDGRPLRVDDVARVTDSIRRVRSDLWINGEPGIEIRVFKQSGANTVEVTQAVRAEVARLNERFGERVHLEVLFDASDYIRAAVSGVTMSALLGALLAVVVLLFFLRSVRATLVVATAIPLSMLATFCAMLSQGMTLNLISFGGLALGVGILVDGAVVILESIYRKREEGLSAVDAAVEGTQEVSSAVIAGTITTVVVFAPVVFVGGLAGVLFGEMAAVVTFSLLCALLVALTLVPMLAAKLLRRPPGGQQGRFARVPRAIERGLDRLEAAYGRLVGGALDAPWTIISGALVLFACSLVLIPRVGVELMPEADEARLEADVELPVGTPLAVTTSSILQAEKLMLEVVRPEERLHVITSAGPENWWRPSGSNESEVDMILVSANQRERGVEELVLSVRDALNELPGAKSRVKASSSNVLSRIIRRGQDRLSVEVVGHDLATADRLAQEVSGILRRTPGVTYARPDRELGQPERVLVVDRARAAELGLGGADIAATVEQYVLGHVATEFRDQGDEFDVRVQLAENERDRLLQLHDLPVVGPAGQVVPLDALVQIHERHGASSISRNNQQRTLRVDAGTAGRPLDAIARDLSVNLRELQVPDGFEVRVGGELAEQGKTFSELAVGILLALFLVYAAMAIQFESFHQPLIIMASVPFAFVGVVLALLATNTTFNMNSFLGAIVLVGVVVNNAIVFVDYANLLRQDDRTSVREALILAGQRRLRPILMTTLTTLLGLVPLAIGFGEGNEMQVPLARAIIGGLTCSSLVTLLLIPCVYLVVEERRQRRFVAPLAARDA